VNRKDRKERKEDQLRLVRVFVFFAMALRAQRSWRLKSGRSFERKGSIVGALDERS
jgi:hypothetical protein